MFFFFSPDVRLDEKYKKKKRSKLIIIQKIYKQTKGR